VGRLFGTTSGAVWLIECAISFQDFQPITIHQRHRNTDGQTDRRTTYLMPPTQRTHKNIDITLISSQSTPYSFCATLPPLVVWVYLHSNFSYGLWNASA